MNCTKESNHKSSKTHKAYQDCKSHSCTKCKGLCIFSNSFLKNYNSIEHAEMTAAEGYHHKEYALIREYRDSIKEQRKK